MPSNLLIHRPGIDAMCLAAGIERRSVRLRQATPGQMMALVRGRLLAANNFLTYDAATEAAVNAFTALLNSGFIKVYTGSQPAVNGAVTGTLLVSMTFGATAFASSTASGGVVTATANSITSGTAGNTGTAGYHALVKSDNTTVCATGTVGTSAADLVLNTLTITSGNTVSCGSYLINMAE